MDGLMDGWINGWIDGWMAQKVCAGETTNGLTQELRDEQ